MKWFFNSIRWRAIASYKIARFIILCDKPMGREYLNRGRFVKIIWGFTRQRIITPDQWLESKKMLTEMGFFPEKK